MLLAGYLSACTSLRTQQASPAQLIPAEHPYTVRVVRLDGFSVDIRSPRVIRDSVIGRQVSQDQRISVALSDIKEIAVERIDVGKTLGFLAVGGWVFFGMFFILLGLTTQD